MTEECYKKHLHGIDFRTHDTLTPETIANYASLSLGNGASSSGTETGTESESGERSVVGGGVARTSSVVETERREEETGGKTARLGEASVGGSGSGAEGVTLERKTRVSLTIRLVPKVVSKNLQNALVGRLIKK